MTGQLHAPAVLPPRKGYLDTALNRHLELQEVEYHKMSSQPAHECDKVASPNHRPLLSTAKVPVTHFC